jgi:hypothetical protein
MAPHFNIVNNSEITVSSIKIEEHWYKIMHPFYIFLLGIMILTVMAAFARVMKMMTHPKICELIEIKA